MADKDFVHPYIPNSEPAVKRAMLDYLGMKSSEDIYKEIPDALRFKGEMDLPEPILSEARLQRHVEGLLDKNRHAKNTLSFLGGGTWNHYVPAVCDTIGARDEFLTAYVGETYSDHGKWQALFETASMIGDLTGFEAAGNPTYDWANAIAIACRMACRTAGKTEILLPKNMSPTRMLVVKNYVKPEIAVKEVGFDEKTGRMDLSDLAAKLSDKTAAVYFENPNYIGAIETEARDIIKAAKGAGALVIAGVDPSSLGVLEAPGAMGADYAVGDYQPLGLHMGYGGSLSG
ncbi:MAG TPA: aminomethyl-transferring glycine dehydrogenase, partial [Clostridiales bacterium]|nr:aminomethyl-transferring glycine dehydrogenase [Clostridiales bacterium]